MLSLKICVWNKTENYGKRPQAKICVVDEWYSIIYIRKHIEYNAACCWKRVQTNDLYIYVEYVYTVIDKIGVKTDTELIRSNNYILIKYEWMH